MAASVLFDAPGPKTRARHRLYAAVSGAVLALIIGLVLWQFWRKGQFALEFWEPFATPRIINVLLEGLFQTLRAAAFAILGALVFGLFFGSGKLSNHRLVRWPAWAVVEFLSLIHISEPTRL